MSYRKTVRMMTVILLMAALLCAWVQALADTEPALHFENDEISVPVKKTVRIAPTTENIDQPKALKYTWTSGDEQIATVQSGAVKGIAPGETVITCRAELPDGKQISCSAKVRVVIPVQSIRIDTKANTPVRAGGALAVACTVLPEDASDKSLMWESSDSSIATVDSTGTVTGVSAGKAIITATTNDGSRKQARVALYIPSLYCETDRLIVTSPEGGSFDVEYCGEDWDNDVTVRVTGETIPYHMEKNGNKVTVIIDGGTFDSGEIEFRDKKDPAAAVSTGIEIYPDEEFRRGVEYMKDEKFYSAYKAFGSSASELAREKEKECLLPRPKDGEIWRDASLKGRDTELVFNVIQPEDKAAVFRIVKDGKTVSCLFVAGTGIVKTRLPSGEYVLKDGSGEQWFGVKEAFGPEGSYETMTFEDDQEKVMLERGYRSTISVNVESLSPGADAVGTVSEGWEGFAE